MAAYEHLPLKRLEGVLERRMHGFGVAPFREAKQHGARIQKDIEDTVASFSALPAIDGINPSLILKVSIAGNIDEDEWRKVGLTVLSVDGDKSVILFANDKSLQDFRNKVEAYQGELPLGQKGAPFAGLVAAIETVSLLTASDRIGPDLRAAGQLQPEDFVAADTYVLDFELYHPPTQGEADIFLYRLKQSLEAAGGAILSTYAGHQMLIARIESNGDGVRAALDLPEVAVADLPPQPDLVTEDITEIDIEELPAGSPPPEGAIVIGIIDSGVNFGHPLLANTEAGAISLDPTWSASDVVGHGTSVASIAAFGDIAARVAAKNFDAQFRIASARVVTDSGHFPKNQLVPDLMEQAITKLHNDYACRIFNISLGDAKRIYKGGRPDTWAATLDGLARDLDVLIIVSAGNRDDLSGYKDGIVAAYPQYLLTDASRIIDPATASNVISVGAIAHANGLEDMDEELAGVRPICGKDEPSPFTRTGPGVRGMIKPDLIDFGGNAVWDGPTGALVSGNQKEAAGIWTMHHKPIEKLFRARSGTSFAAPNLAYKAALLLSHFPQASANLLRSLLSISASVPKAVILRPRGLNEKGTLMACGYGVCNADHAATSDDGRVVLYAEDELPLDHFAVFEVPIPTEFQTTKGTREIKVALAFDPPVRHTRADYLGITMGWRLLRGTSESDVFDRYRKWTKEEGKPPEFPSKLVCPTDIGSDLRDRGTLQVATYQGKQDISRYGDKYFVAVWCSRRWAPIDIEYQRYALSVQLRHENVTTLYQTLRQPVRLQA
jgi:subtilisin family serine protease